jgi:hypothetical protein
LSRVFPETLCTLDEEGSNAILPFSEDPPCEDGETFESFVSWAGAGTVRVKDKSGHLPLNTICYLDTRLSFAKPLVEAYPVAIRIPDCEGSRSFHLACGQTLEQ